MAPRFVTKNILATRGVQASLEAEELNREEVFECLTRHYQNKGEECKADNKLNEEAIKHEEGRVFSTFTLSNNKRLWIITDGLHLAKSSQWGNQYPYTTIMFPEEY